MRLLLIRLSPFIRSPGTPLAILLGIMLGILMAMPYNIGFMVLLGWILVPFNFLRIYEGDRSLLYPFGAGGYKWPDWTIWGLRGVVLCYLLFLLCSGWCAYRAMRQTGRLRDALLHAIWIALVVLISAIIPATFTGFFLEGHNLSDLLWTAGAYVEFCAFLLLPFVGIALVAGLIGAGLASRLTSKIRK